MCVLINILAKIIYLVEKKLESPKVGKSESRKVRKILIIYTNIYIDSSKGHTTICGFFRNQTAALEERRQSGDYLPGEEIAFAYDGRCKAA